MERGEEGPQTRNETKEEEMEVMFLRWHELFSVCLFLSEGLFFDPSWR